MSEVPLQVSRKWTPSPVSINILVSNRGVHSRVAYCTVQGYLSHAKTPPSTTLP